VTVSVQVFASDPDQAPVGFVVDGVAYDITATATLNGTVTLTFPFSNISPAGVTPTVEYYEPGDFTPTAISPSAVTSVAWDEGGQSGTISVSSNHFSVWIVVQKAPGAPGTFAQTGAGLGKPTWGPVPAAAGQAVSLYFDKAPASGSAQIYNVAGQQVASTTFGSSESVSLQTNQLAAGVYFVRTVVQYLDGSAQTVFQKIVIVR
jgi:hypothetical protein